MSGQRPRRWGIAASPRRWGRCHGHATKVARTWPANSLIDCSNARKSQVPHQNRAKLGLRPAHAVSILENLARCGLTTLANVGVAGSLGGVAGRLARCTRKKRFLVADWAREVGRVEAGGVCMLVKSGQCCRASTGLRLGTARRIPASRCPLVQLAFGICLRNWPFSRLAAAPLFFFPILAGR
jgi:hypothetical protein